MNWEQLDRLIDELEALLPERQVSVFNPGYHRSDWKTFWAKAGQTQQGFNSGVRYPTKQLRDEAWERFNKVRSLASQRASEEQDHLRDVSESCRNEILSEAESARHSPWIDAVWDKITFSTDKTTVENMKALGRTLASARRMLSEYKDKMFGEHKRECYEKIAEIQQTHDEWWERYKEAREREREAWEQRRNERRERIRANIEKNRERLAKATDALERQRERAAELRSKIAETRSDKWSQIFEDWLSETERKIDDIEESVRRLEAWIEEDGRKLDEMD